MTKTKTKVINQLLVGGLMTNLETGVSKTSAPIAYSWLLGQSSSSYPSDEELAQAYLASPWAFRCIQQRATALSSIDWEIQKHLKNKNVKVLGDDDECVALLRYVNPETNWNDLIRATESDLLIYGRAYWLKIRGESTRSVVALLKLNPSTVELQQNRYGIEGFVQTLDGVKEFFPREDVVYFRDYNPVHDLEGISTLAIVKPAVDAQSNSTEMASLFFKNGAIPGVVLSTEQDIDEDDATFIKKMWDRAFKGVKNWGKTAVLGKGVKASTVGSPPKEWSMDTIDEAARREICSAFGVGPALVGAWEAANYATAVEQRKSLYTDTIIPRAMYLAGVINAELVTVEFNPDYEFTWLFEEISVLQEDEKLIADRYIALVQAGIITPEVAAQELGFEAEQVPVAESEVPQSSALEVNEEQPAKSGPIRVEVAEENQHPLEVDLKKWLLVKAAKRLKANKPALCEFKSEYIPETLAQAIMGQLETAETLDDLHGIYDSIRQNISVWQNYP